MTLAKVKEQDGMTLAKVRHASTTRSDPPKFVRTSPIMTRSRTQARRGDVETPRRNN